MREIFILEDDTEISKNLAKLLTSEGFSVTCCETQRDAIDILPEKKFDLALLDLSLPDGSGFCVCTEIKERMNIPVIFLTASGDESSVVTGLNMGADDYITKPFRPRELLARINNALRKSGNVPTFELDGLSLNTTTGVLKKNGKEVFLSALDYRLLLVFINNPNTIITRDRLIDELWDAAGEYVCSNSLTVYIKRLRERIEDDPANPKIILTVRGIGYRLGGSHA